MTGQGAIDSGTRRVGRWSTRCYAGTLRQRYDMLHEVFLSDNTNVRPVLIGSGGCSSNGSNTWWEGGFPIALEKQKYGIVWSAATARSHGRRMREEMTSPGVALLLDKRRTHVTTCQHAPLLWLLKLLSSSYAGGEHAKTGLVGLFGRRVRLLLEG